MPYPLTQVGRARTPVLDTTYAAEKRSDPLRSRKTKRARCTDDLECRSTSL